MDGDVLMTSEITNCDDILDSRDIAERIKELDAEREEMGFDEDEEPEAVHELEALEKLKKEGKEAFGSEWGYGVTLIRDEYFAEYAQELAEEIGAIDRDAHWPNDHINWEEAAEALQMDYTTIEFDGETYWGRA
jgi:hypothetical protein